MTTENDALEEFLRRATRGFEADSSVLSDDGERIERMQRAVQRRFNAAPRRAARLRHLMVGAACGFLVAGAAFAGLRFAQTSRDSLAPMMPAPSPKVMPVPSTPPEASTTGAVTLGSEQPPADAQLQVPAPKAEAPRASRLGPAAPTPSTAEIPNGPSAKAFDEAPLTAGELFAAANRARVAGNAAQAVALSDQLIAQFPRSPEAISARLSLGMLLLQQGQADRALREFEAYEKLGSGQGRAEALWGKAQALQRLGRSAEERAALRELVEKYPRAAYTAAAQKRLTATQ